MMCRAGCVMMDPWAVIPGNYVSRPTPQKFGCALRAIKPETSCSGHILVRDKMKHQLTWEKRTGQVLRFEIFQGVFKVASSS
jgi:hypothetical protein